MLDLLLVECGSRRGRGRGWVEMLYYYFLGIFLRCCIIPPSKCQRNKTNSKINGLTLASDFHLENQGRVGVKFRNKVLTLIHIITENRNMCASGPVVPSIPLHEYWMQPVCDVNTVIQISCV